MSRRITRKSYLVAIPVPSLDRKGEPLDEEEINASGRVESSTS